MGAITLQLPKKLSLDTKDTIRFLAAKLYESGKLSLGEAATLAGLSKRAFSEILGDYDVALINHPIDEIKDDAGRI